MGSSSARSPHGSQHPSRRPRAGKIPYRVMNRRRKGRRISSHSPQGKGMNGGRPQWVPSRSSLTAGRARRRYRDFVPFFPGRPAVRGFHRRRHQPRARAGPFGDTTDLTFHRISASSLTVLLSARSGSIWAPKYYKGDNHTGYDGSYRVLVTYSFTWDGQEIGDVATDVEYGATHLMQDGCPDLVKTVTSEGDITAPGAASFQMHMSSKNPIEPFAPTIDSSLKGTFTRPDELSFDLTPDKFPSHGFRVIKNGQIVATVVDFDASCVSGAVSIALGLTAGDRGDWHHGHQDIALNVPGQSFFEPCGGNAS